MEPTTDAAPLELEGQADGICEGMVVTCAHCGRPAAECSGEDCAHVLETRDFMVPGYRTGIGKPV
jgi:hypothetical protein